jgi:hypothetical protein
MAAGSVYERRRTVKASAKIATMGGRGSEEGFVRFERELVQERAAALVRISSALEGLLHSLDRLRSEAAAAASGPDRDERLALHTLTLKEARRYRWYLEVQREALGLRNHAGLDEHYPMPEPLAR